MSKLLFVDFDWRILQEEQRHKEETTSKAKNTTIALIY
jgi:hypothetical protein